MSARLALQGHALTLAPFFGDLFHPPPAPTAAHFSFELEDELRGKVRLTGRLSIPEGATTLVLIVHGLGGSARSPYAVRAAAAASERGFASLRLDLRGASLRGDDFYHAGLSSDLHAVLTAPSLERFVRVFVLGFSLGGHLTLKLATEDPPSRVQALCAVCPPLHLGDAQLAIDRPSVRPYLRHVLTGLKEMYRALDARGNAALPLKDALAIDRIRDWDELVIAPRFGFAGAGDYYERASVAPRLDVIGRPTLLLTCPYDPMIPGRAITPHLSRIARSIDHRAVLEGGHVGFPAHFDLDEPAGLGLAPQVLSWLARVGA